MSAATSMMRYSADAIDFAPLIAATVAAPLLGIHIDSLTRLCREKLKAESKAILAAHDDGGREQWFIDRSYHPHLASGAVVDPRQIEPDLSSYSARQRDQALQKKECVLAWRRLRSGRISGSMADAIRVLIGRLVDSFPDVAISRSRLYVWNDLYACPADLIKLVDFRGGVDTRRGCLEAWNRFAELWLHENQPTKKQCWREVRDEANEKGWEWCSYISLIRQLDERIPIAEQIKGRSPREYRQQLSPYIAQRVEAWDAGECWVGDHKELDLLCRFGGSIVRPWLTAWMDWRTRKIVGWVLSDNPNSTTILGALRHGLKDAANYGGPASLWIDNGKDYDAWMFHGQTKQQRRSRIKPNLDEDKAVGIFRLLRIEPHFSIAHNPNGKARLERWFRNLKSFSDTVETSTGDSIETKPERLAKILKLGHLIPTFKEIHERIAAHIAGYNLNADHAMDDLIEAGEKLSPAAALERWHPNVRIMADPKSLDYLLMHWHRPVPVGRNGVTFCFMGERLHYGQFCPALERFKGLSKEKRGLVVGAYDPADLSEITLFTLDGRFIARAQMNRVGGFHNASKMDMQTLGEIHREKTQYNRSRKIDRKRTITHILTTEEQLSHRATVKAIEAQQPPQATPGTIQLIQTPLDGQAEVIERQQQRKAVGDAEYNDTFQQLTNLMREAEGKPPIASGRFEYHRPAEIIWAEQEEQEEFERQQNEPRLQYESLADRLRSLRGDSQTTEAK